MTKPHHMTAKLMANEYRIWCAASAVNWDCTINDIAEATGLARSTVRHALYRRGWLERVADDRHDTNYGRLPTDVMINKTNEGWTRQFYR